MGNVDLEIQDANCVDFGIGFQTAGFYSICLSIASFQSYLVV